MSKRDLITFGLGPVSNTIVFATATGTAIAIIAGVTLDWTASSLTIPATWTKVWFTVKRSVDDTDGASVLQLVETSPSAVTDGLLVVQGASPASPVAVTDGALTVDQAAGTVQVVVKAIATAELEREGQANLTYDLKVLSNTDVESILTSGTASVSFTATHAT